MPTLPTQEDLRPRIPQTGGNIVSMQGGAMGRALQQVGQQSEQIVENEIRLDNEYRFASAETKLMVGQEKLLASLQDDDFESYQKRYEEGIRQIKQDAAGMIRSPRDMAAFENRAALLLTRGQLEVQSRAKAKEIDYMRADFENNLSELGNVAMTTADLNGIVEQASFAVDSAVNQGYIRAEDGESRKREFAVDVATRRLEMLPPEARMTILDSRKGEAALIPEDQRVLMTQKAQAELITQRNLQKSLEREANDQLYEQAYAELMTNGGDLSKIDLTKYRGLRPSQLDSLVRLAERKSAGYAQVTDPDTYYKLKNLFSDPSRRTEAADFPLTDSHHLLSESDYKTFTNAQAELRGEAVEEPVVDAITTEAGVVKEALRRMEIETGEKAGPTDLERGAIFTQMVEQRKGDRLRELRAQNPKLTRLPQDELRKIVYDLTVEVTVQKNWWPDSKVFAWEQEVPEQDRAQIIDALESTGKIVSEAAIRNLYLRKQAADGR